MRDDPAAFTLPSERRDFVEWHRGRPWYAVWAAPLDDAEVAARLANVRSALHPLLLPGHRRQPHLTLQVCGFPGPPGATAPDDFAQAALETQCEALRSLGAGPVRLRIGAPFSFASAACLAVHDEQGGLDALRAALQQACAGPDRSPWVPHVTAGLYAGRWPMAEVRGRLDGLRDGAPRTLTLRFVDWMVYDTREIDGPLRTLLRVDLLQGTARREAALVQAFAGRSSGPAESGLTPSSSDHARPSPSA